MNTEQTAEIIESIKSEIKEHCTSFMEEFLQDYNKWGYDDEEDLAFGILEKLDEVKLFSSNVIDNEGSELPVSFVCLQELISDCYDQEDIDVVDVVYSHFNELENTAIENIKNYINENYPDISESSVSEEETVLDKPIVANIFKRLRARL